MSKKEKNNKPKTVSSLSVKELKAIAFDLDMQMKQTQQQYNQVIQEIVEKQKEPAKKVSQPSDKVENVK